MSYRLEDGELLESGVKRIAEEQVTGALSQLQAGKIYEVRKSIKRLRALLHLLKPNLGPIYLEDNRRLRDTARSFSGLRDFDVSLELLDRFAAHYKRTSTLNPYRKALHEKRSTAQKHVTAYEAADMLAGTRKRIEDWPLLNLTWASLKTQLAKTHKQGWLALQLAINTRNAENFHAFRKRVKRELNQLRLIHPDDPHFQTLKELNTLLGDHHNLVVLLSNLDNMSKRFRHLIEAERTKLETRIVSLASSSYHQKTTSAAA